MQQVTTDSLASPVEYDPEVLAFRAQFDGRSPLDEIIRSGAQQMLQVAIETEVNDFLLQHVDRRDDQGNRRTFVPALPWLTRSSTKSK